MKKIVLIVVILSLCAGIAYANVEERKEELKQEAQTVVKNMQEAQKYLQQQQERLIEINGILKEYEAMKKLEAKKDSKEQ